VILVLFLGQFLNGRFGFLRRFNIPEPVSGGIIASVFLGALHLLFDADVVFSDHYRDILLVVFFTSIGLGTDVKSIVKGGRVLGLFAALAVFYLFAHSIVGVLVAGSFDINPNLGVLAGSASLQGGHGNVVAWAPILTSASRVALGRARNHRILRCPWYPAGSVERLDRPRRLVQHPRGFAPLWLVQ
jgi:ESS family glutamate:Na+ symporter